MTKTQAISQMILTNVANGMTIREAIDAVCGAGASDQLISDLYDELRAAN